MAKKNGKGSKDAFIIIVALAVVVFLVWQGYLINGGARTSLDRVALTAIVSSTSGTTYSCTQIECECQSNPFKSIFISRNVCLGGGLNVDTYLDQECHKECTGQGYSYGFYLSLGYPENCTSLGSQCTAQVSP